MHFEHQTIENTALPATWLRQVNPQPQNRRERAYSHRQNALFGTGTYPFHTTSMPKGDNITVFFDNYFATTLLRAKFHINRFTVLIFSKISPIFEIWLCLCANCKVNCQTQPITVELTTVSNLNAAISCTDDLAHNFFFNTRPAA